MEPGLTVGTDRSRLAICGVGSPGARCPPAVTVVPCRATLARVWASRLRRWRGRRSQPYPMAAALDGHRVCVADTELGYRSGSATSGGHDGAARGAREEEASADGCRRNAIRTSRVGRGAARASPVPRPLDPRQPDVPGMASRPDTTTRRRPRVLRAVHHRALPRDHRGDRDPAARGLRCDRLHPGPAHRVGRDGRQRHCGAI